MRQYMKITVIFYCLFATIGLLSASDLEYTPRELIIKTSTPLNTRGTSFGIPELDHFLAEKSVREIKPVLSSNDNRYFVVRLNENFSWEELRQRNLHFQNIEYIQPNYLNKMFIEPNDPRFHEQSLHLIGLPQAWYYETGNNQVIVAIIDSGLDFTHPEFCGDSEDFADCLSSNIWINNAEWPPNGLDSSGNGYIDDWRGWDFVDAPEMADIAVGDYIDQDNDPSDETGHGTHVTGIVGARTNNDIGISGVCWNVKLMILRAGFRTTAGPGMLQDDDAAAAIIYAADNGAHVINLSWGSHSYSPIIADACQYAYDRGTIIVASAGNVPQPELMYPAKLNTTISVGSVNNNLNLSGFSSHGPDLDLVAPGENVLSTHLVQEEEMYRRLSGTSMSAPLVSGAVALLLSAEPGLSFNEVRSRLLTTTVDLGEQGFDNSFGHGLLNLENLLTGAFNPYISISYPGDNMGLSDSFEIIGTVNTPNFFRYSIMFSDQLSPGPLDWKDVNTHHNHPRFYYQEVSENTLATFFVPYTMPDDEYIIRIRLETTTGEMYEKRTRVHINKSIPSLKTESLSVVKRYRDDRPYYFVQAGFDQQVDLQLDIFSDSGVDTSVYSNYPDSLHYLQVPDYIPQGSISLRLKATNTSNLEYESPLFTDIETISRIPIPTDTFTQTTIGPATVAAGKSVDFDDNNKLEFVGMTINENGTYGATQVYEFDNMQLSLKHTFEDSFLPLDVGNTNNQGIEVIGRVLDSIYLFDTYGDQSYPNIALKAFEDSEGGSFFDYTNNGVEDLIIIRNYQNNRVLSLYERTGNIFNETNILFNTTTTDQLNTFVPRVAVGDLNNSGNQNVLAADTDGDIMVFEIYGAEADSLIWTHRLPVPNAYHLSISDFTGDGNLDFCVGGYKNDYDRPEKTFWYFEFFSYSEGLFRSIGYISLDHFESVNSIRSIDLTNDGKSELVLALTPHLYIISYENGEFVPIWKGNSSMTFQVIPIEPINLANTNRLRKQANDSGNRNYTSGIIVNAFEDDMLGSQFVTLSDYAGPPAPSGLSVSPVNESSVTLDWFHPGADHYLVFRKVEDETAIIDTILTTSYTDTGLVKGTEYLYAIKAVDESYYPTTESIFSTWKGAIPYTVPELLEIKMTAVNELSLHFSTPLSNDAVNNGNFLVNNGIGTPYSVIHTHIHHGLLLRFNTMFTPMSEGYSIFLTGIKGRSGVPLPDAEFDFDFVEDLISPVVESYAIYNDIELQISFSKDLNQVYASDIDNFELYPPQIDILNEIQSISCSGSTVAITFKEKLKYSNQSYYLKMSNLEDLAGNKLPNNQNILKFQLMQIDNLDHVQVVPNPFVRNQSGHYRIQFIGLPTGLTGKIQIYNLSGEAVFSESIGPLTDKNSNYLWNGVNKANKELSSGVYFYILQMGNHIKKGQIAIVN
jgi:subtilisin family serine protease